MNRLLLRVALSDSAEEEFNRIDDFYAKNRHEGNAIRDPQVLMKSIEDSKAYVIEDFETRELVSVSFCFSINDGDYTEFGGTRSILNGYGIQKLLTYARAMGEFMMAPPEYEAYTIVARWNDKSINNIKNAGFLEWDPDKKLTNIIKPYDPEQKMFFNLPKNALNTIKNRFLDIVEAGELSGREGSPSIKLDVMMRIISQNRLTRDLVF